MVRLLLLSANMSGNALGRSQSLWLLARHLGWDVHVAGPYSGELWAPLRTSDFGKICHPIASGREGKRVLIDFLAWADATIAVKALPESFGLAHASRSHMRGPLLLDIDDPDLEEILANEPLRAKFGLVHPRRVRLGLHPLQLSLLQRRIRSVPVLTSNPVLRARHGGTLIPHVRKPIPPGRPHRQDQPTVAFVGTPKPHKGIVLLREAVAATAADGFSLVVTAKAPSDVAPWERWLGETSITEGRVVLDGADIVALPSLRTGFGKAQLPVKVIDAMVSGRAIIASDLPVLRWALGEAAIFTRPGSVESLTRALRLLQDPVRRSALGRSARRRALEMFTPHVVAPDLLAAVEAARRSVCVTPSAPLWRAPGTDR